MVSFYREARDCPKQVRLRSVIRQMLDRLLDEKARLLARALGTE
jgi:hypothetical protein